MQIHRYVLILIKKMKPVCFDLFIVSLCVFSEQIDGLLLGKTIFQPSPIDEEIKKALVLETLKLALPKKKLQT